MQYRGSLPIFPAGKKKSNVNMCDHGMEMNKGKSDALFTLTWVLGKADVRSVSWVSSAGFLLGTLRTKAAWSHVAAVEVMR